MESLFGCNGTTKATESYKLKCGQEQFVFDRQFFAVCICSLSQDAEERFAEHQSCLFDLGKAAVA